MKKMSNIMKTLIVGVLSTVMLIGCGQAFDASGYVKAILDVSYKGETAKYMELTNSTEEEANEIYQGNLEYNMNEFSTMPFSDEMQQNYEQLFKDMMSKTKYTVGEARETENKNYEVDVTIETMNIMDDATYEEFITKSEEYGQQVQNDVANGGTMPSEDEIQMKIFEIYYNLLREKVDAGLTYEEPQVVTVRVEKDSNNVYTVSEEDLTALDEAMFTMTDLAE